MKIYIDNDYKCHSSNNGTMREFEVPFFDGKCAEYIVGFRYVPAGETWTRKDGEVFKGEMICAWKPYNELDELQRKHERQLLAEYAEALKVVGVDV